MLNEIDPRAVEQFILPRLIAGGRHPAQNPTFPQLSAESERRRNPQPVECVPDDWRRRRPLRGPEAVQYPVTTEYRALNRNGAG